MKRHILLLLLLTGLFSACQKKDQTLTRVGFYILDADYSPAPDEPAPMLYIDNQNMGPLQVSTVETGDTSLMNFQTLDATKHTIEVRDGNTVTSSTWLQIGRCKTASGASGMTLGVTVGSKYNKQHNLNYGTYAIFL